MASIESGTGGRKANLELNIVPFIDLMSVLITFLLITAVWSQVSMIQLGSSVFGKQTDVPPRVNDLNELPLRLSITSQGYTLLIGKQNLSLPRVGSEFDEAGLVAQLEKAKQLYPAKQDALVAIANDLSYEHLIKGMDLLIRSGFPTVSVETGDPQ